MLLLDMPKSKKKRELDESSSQKREKKSLRCRERKDEQKLEFEEGLVKLLSLARRGDYGVNLRVWTPFQEVMVSMVLSFIDSEATILPYSHLPSQQKSNLQPNFISAPIARFTTFYRYSFFRFSCSSACQLFRNGSRIPSTIFLRNLDSDGDSKLIDSLHSEQEFLCRSDSSIHGLQKACPQGVSIGSTIISKQIGQLNFSRVTIALSGILQRSFSLSIRLPYFSFPLANLFTILILSIFLSITFISSKSLNFLSACICFCRFLRLETALISRMRSPRDFLIDLAIVSKEIMNYIQATA